MNPSEFKEKWGLTNAELAVLTGWSLDSINHWFSDREPPAGAKVLLAQTDALWESWQALEKGLPPQVRTLYEEAVKRKLTSDD